MKTLLFLIILVTANVSQAWTRILYCAGKSQVFTAEYPRLPYFVLKNAQLTGDSTHTNFICEPSSTLFTDMKCNGFWNDDSSMPVEVSFTTTYPRPQVFFKLVATNETTSLACKFEDIP